VRRQTIQGSYRTQAAREALEKHTTRTRLLTLLCEPRDKTLLNDTRFQAHPRCAGQQEFVPVLEKTISENSIRGKSAQLLIAAGRVALRRKRQRTSSSRSRTRTAVIDVDVISAYRRDSHNPKAVCFMDKIYPDGFFTGAQPVAPPHRAGSFPTRRRATASQLTELSRSLGYQFLAITVDVLEKCLHWGTKNPLHASAGVTRTLGE
jgi:hypothetical protein